MHSERVSRSNTSSGARSSCRAKLGALGWLEMAQECRAVANGVDQRVFDMRGWRSSYLVLPVYHIAGAHESAAGIANIAGEQRAMVFDGPNPAEASARLARARHPGDTDPGTHEGDGANEKLVVVGHYNPIEKWYAGRRS
jgi:hypothetical protein